nr:TonB-dependent receptor [Sphingomonas xinjiangensis]
MPGYTRWTARPRLFWEGPAGARALLTFGAMTERREGGTVPGRTVPDKSSFVQAQRSERFDLGLNAQTPLDGIGTLYLRASGVTQSHRHRFGETLERDHHRTGFVEASLGGTAGSTTWLAGAAFQADGYRSRAFPAFDYGYTVPALFVQGENDVADTLTLAASARWDGHSDYGSRVSPRLSALFRPRPVDGARVAWARLLRADAVRRGDRGQRPFARTTLCPAARRNRRYRLDRPRLCARAARS